MGATPDAGAGTRDVGDRAGLMEGEVEVRGSRNVMFWCWC